MKTFLVRDKGIFFLLLLIWSRRNTFTLKISLQAIIFQILTSWHAYIYMSMWFNIFRVSSWINTTFFVLMTTTNLLWWVRHEMTPTTYVQEKVGPLTNGVLLVYQGGCLISSIFFHIGIFPSLFTFIF